MESISTHNSASTQGIGPACYWTALPDRVLHRILAHLNLMDAVDVSLTCKASYHILKEHTVLRISRCISGFALPVQSTIDLMKDQDIIVSGSAALSVIDNDTIPGDLDFYVPRGRLEAVDIFLTHHASFRRVIDDRPASRNVRMYHSPGARDETGMVSCRYYVDPSGAHLINVIETRLHSPISAVFMFHSTFVMNYFTWNTVVSTYPSMLRHGLGLRNAYEEAQLRELRVLLKYIHRGYRNLRSAEEWMPQHCCGEYPYCAQTVRHISDQFTMRVRFGEGHEDIGNSAIFWKLACRSGCRGQSRWRSCNGAVFTQEGEVLVKSAHQELVG